MQMIAEGASRSNYSTMGAGGWIRRLNAITAAAFILTITLEQMQIGLIKSKSRGLKKNIDLTLQWPLHLQKAENRSHICTIHPCVRNVFHVNVLKSVAHLTEGSEER